MPAFGAAHLFSRGFYALSGLESFAPNGYTVIYQLATLLSVIGYGFLMMVLLDGILENHFRVKGSAIAPAILLFCGATHYAYYYFREPVMVHIVSAYWITLCLASGIRASRGGTQVLHSLGLMTLAFAMAIIARPTNVFIGPFMAFGFGMTLKQSPRGGFVLRAAVISLAALWPLALQIAVWKITTGAWFSYSYKSEGFPFLQSPYLWSTLFSSRHGLFFWSPILVLSILGIGLRLYHRGLRQDWALTTLVGGAGILWYFNSSWHQWWFGDAFGGRAFLELAPLFVFGLAFFFDWAQNAKKPVLSYAIKGFVGISVFYTYALMALYITHKIPRADYLF